MSFSSDVKEELNCIQTLANKELVKSELQGYLISNNVKIIEKGTKRKIRFSTESEYNINRFARLLSNCKIQEYKIQMQGKNYVIELALELLRNIIEVTDIGIKIERNEIGSRENAKATIRGAFLGSGSINNPENSNHLEVQLSNEINCTCIEELLEQFDIKAKRLSENRIYIKDGEEISKFLACIGANKSVLKFEDIRLKHEMNNKINRLVNCEGANLNKIMNASIEQIEAINKLKRENKFKNLDDNLKEIANLRLENPNANLTELGQMLKIPVGKSGVNYRLRKIIELSK
ncbi:MAG: DNA-binding protein WhiA [Clostridia bacterium]|nr:DNA-binding protein WhiA [Clostridia bacterium]